MKRFPVRTLLAAIVLVSGLGLTASAATITTQAECFDGATHNENFDPHNCYVGNTRGTAIASFTVPTSASDFTLATLETYASPYFYGSSVLTTASITAEFDTAGPLRAGYIQVVASIPSIILSVDGATGTTQISIGSYSSTCHWFGDAEQGCTDGRSGNVMVPFILGEPFSVDLSQSVGADTYAGASGGGGLSTVEFRFFEADGFTSVAASEVVAAPEPATWGLIGVPGLFALLRWRRSQLSRPRVKLLG
jgi:hypothetical protein